MKRSIDRRVHEELLGAGFHLERAGRHCVYRRASDNARIIVAITPRSGADHQLHWVRQDIRRMDKEKAS